MGVYFYDHGTGSGPQLLFDDPEGAPIDPRLAFSEQCCCVDATCTQGHPIDRAITCLKNVPASVVDLGTYQDWLATLSVEAIWDDGWTAAPAKCSPLDCADNDSRLVTLPWIPLLSPIIWFEETFQPCLPVSVAIKYRTQFWIWCNTQPDPPGDLRCWAWVEIREFDTGGGGGINLNLEFELLLPSAIDLTNFELEIPLTDHVVGAFPNCTFNGSTITIRST